MLADQRHDALMERLRRLAGCVQRIADKVGELPAPASLADTLRHLGQWQRLVQPKAARQLAG